MLSSIDQEKTMRFKRFLLISLFYGLLVILILNPTQVNGAESRNISGFVFIDHNENGLKDDGEPGLPNVAVSNQREVVLTDEQGRYNLPVRENMIVFVSQPAGFELPRNEHNLPQFYYIHHPEGSPDGLKYPGIAPTGKLPDEINFPLYTAPYKENFKALISGDPQPRDSVEVGYFRDDIITEMIGSDTDFYLALGDIAYDDLSIYDQYNRAVSQIGLPAFHVGGNHDVNFRVDSDTFSLETFNRIYGPEYYSFNYGQVHFVVLDNVEYLGWDWENQKSKGYRGYISEDQLLWLENDLRYVPDDFLIVLSMHIPLYTKISPGASVNVANREALFRLMQNRQQVLVLSAHMHILEHLYLGKEQGWPGEQELYTMNLAAACGAWWSGPKDPRGIPESYCLDGTPNGYFVFSFQGNRFNYRFVPANYHPDYQLRISSPAGVLERSALDTTQIIVNVFNADPETRVFFQLNDLPRQILKRERMRDPFMQRHLRQNRDTFARWISDVAENDHMWVGALPENLPAGTHTLRVSASDKRGNLYSGVRIFEVK